ncbi:MAG: hypothetical protein PHQ65_02160 [Bacteroidales bacterium]|nr:hypothetical protein [Bacteroidales bacterium]MDD3664044.1 hypothetical protein [Bacteroidales bacterium]
MRYIRYKIDPERNLLIEVLKGTIDLGNLIEVTSRVTSDADFVSVRKIISNITEAQINLSPPEMTQFTNMMVSLSACYQPRWALLSETPRNTALSLLLQETPPYNQLIGVFSTLEACSNFLNVELFDDDFSEDGFICL